MMQIDDRSLDFIAFNGCIHTLDSSNSIAEAVAARDGCFVAIGSTEEIKSLADSHTTSLDLEGRMAIPGFLDAHNHLLERGIDLSWIRLHECASIRELLTLVRDRVRESQPGEWIIGRGWNEVNFEAQRMPTRHDIDAVAPYNPVVLIRQVQAYLVNSQVLELMGVDADTPDPKGGTIGHYDDGEPNGLLWGSAKNIVQSYMPQPTTAEMKEALTLAVGEIQRLGITSVVEPGLRPHEIGAYQRLHETGDLAVRVNLMPSWHGYWADLEEESQLDCRVREMGIHSGFGNEWLRIGALKMAMDVAFIPPTARRQEGHPDSNGIGAFHRLDVGSLPSYLRMAHRLSWDVGIHCHSDRLQELVLAGLREAQRAVPVSDARHSIIHGELPTNRALREMAQQDVALVMQPGFMYTKCFDNIEEAQIADFQPTRRYLDHGIRVVASSDVPYAPSADPFLGLYVLVTRRNQDGLLGPDQAIDRESALRAYTQTGTWLTREEHLKGTIEVGKLADLVVLDRDYYAVPSEEIRQIKVVTTVLGGEVVYQDE